MKFELWYLVIGALLVAIAMISVLVRRLPLTTTMLYLGVGIALGPAGFGVIHVDAVKWTELLQRLSELAVIVSLFTAGLKLRVPLSLATWSVPLRLAFVSMTLTVGMISAVGTVGLGLPLGAAVLLGAILAPTDPVLASEVQLESPSDRDKLRFSLTAEAGLNDGTAFPFALLGVGLLGLHDIGPGGWRWWVIDVFWSVLGGLGIGALLGAGVGYLVVYLRRERNLGFGREEFLALGLIGLSYGVALALHTYGFLAVFAAGVALRVIERRSSGDEPVQELAAAASAHNVEEIATDPRKGPLHMAQSVLAFNEQLERVFEVALVLIVGAMLAPDALKWEHAWFVAVVLFAIRPVAVLAGLFRETVELRHRMFISWFGIRGIGSIYYLTHAIGFGVPEDIARDLVSLTLWIIAVSVVVHGVSVTPLMSWYERRAK